MTCFNVIAVGGRMLKTEQIRPCDSLSSHIWILQVVLGVNHDHLSFRRLTRGRLIVLMVLLLFVRTICSRQRNFIIIVIVSTIIILSTVIDVEGVTIVGGRLADEAVLR